jgi:hypothetical protein
MRKFMRTRKDTNEDVEMFGTEGVIKSISQNSKSNSNGNVFYNFTAEIKMPRGNILCLGQVYENSFEFLGGKPAIGAKFGFTTAVYDLMQGNNKVWSISGLSVDEIDEAMLSDIDAL